jgi:cobalt-zinc-cadmium efflux system outer membrane protein
MLLSGAERALAQSPASPSSIAPDAVPLSEALRLAHERAPSIRAAHERQQAAEGARGAVPRLPNPFIELRGENFGSQPATVLTHDVFATVSQPIELGGKRGARVATADAILTVAEAQVLASGWMLDFEVVSLYVEALRGRELLVTLTEQQARIGDLVNTLSQRVREGISAEADLRKFETEHQRLLREAMRTDIAARSALIRLSTVLGATLRLEQLVPLPPPVVALPSQPEASMLESRPDVVAAHARVAYAEASLGVERARRMPDVTVTAGYKRTSGFDTAVAGVALPINLFDRNRAPLALAAGEVSAAQLELQRVQQVAEADAQAYLTAAARLAEQTASATEDLLEPASVVREAARAAYVEGRGDVLQLVDAERVFAEVSREVIELRLDALLAYIHARLSLGEAPLP